MKVFVVLLLASVALAQDKDLVDTLVDLGCSETVAYVQRAGLEDVIRNGQFTVFAPTNAAWDTLPDYIRRVIVGAPEYLAQILTYHVTTEQRRAGSLTNEGLITSVEGSNIRTNIYRSGQLVTATGAPISTVDVVASNGIIHLLDTVMLPIPRGTMVEEVVFDPDLSILAELVGIAGLADTLNGPGPFTLFAPGNSAFRALPDGVLDGLRQNPEALRGILLYHVIGSTNWSVSLENGDVPTLNGATVRIAVSEEGVRVNNADVEFPDVGVSNGVLHYVDTVLLPPQ